MDIGAAGLPANSRHCQRESCYPPPDLVVCFLGNDPHAATDTTPRSGTGARSVVRQAPGTLLVARPGSKLIGCPENKDIRRLMSANGEQFFVLRGRSGLSR